MPLNFYDKPVVDVDDVARELSGLSSVGFSVTLAFSSLPLLSIALSDSVFLFSLSLLSTFSLSILPLFHFMCPSFLNIVIIVFSYFPLKDFLC